MPPPRASISCAERGSNLQPGEQLLLNGQPVVANGTVQNGVYLFTVIWHGKEHLHSIGIVNPDGTAAQTQVSVQTSKKFACPDIGRVQ
jgi:hypothetical protein